MTIQQKIEKLRQILIQNNLDAYLINGTDPHDSEYVCEHWQQRQYISGFTGSAGVVLVSREKAIIWVDSRYFIQCQKEIKNTPFEMHALDGPNAEKVEDYLTDTFNSRQKIGIADQTLMLQEYRRYKEKGLNIVPCKDLLDQIWENREPLPSSKIREMKADVAGQTYQSKIEAIRADLKKDKASYCLIASLDDIAWILNLRASDMAYIPVFYSYLLIGLDKTILFTSERRFQVFVTSDLEYEIREYDQIYDYLRTIDKPIVINPKRINYALYTALPKVKIVEKQEYSTALKSIKNPTEIQFLTMCHVTDAIALIRLFSYLENNKEGQSELSIASKLEDFKKEFELYQGPSFKTISAFAEHGAIVHYSADENSNAKIDKSGLLVLDSGSQYAYGTTDVTRTLLFGKATEEEKQHYTAVLKGHIALAKTVFPKGTTGSQLDAIAKNPIWRIGCNYYHGTGHGVGFNLSVHEGPQRISSRSNDVQLKEGMTITDEPGIYIENKYGIRIENLLVVQKAGTKNGLDYFGFASLTMCPYERKLIVKEMLTDEEIRFIDSYHNRIREMFTQYLNDQEKTYLKKATKPL